MTKALGTCGRTQPPGTAIARGRQTVSNVLTTVRTALAEIANFGRLTMPG